MRVFKYVLVVLIVALMFATLNSISLAKTETIEFIVHNRTPRTLEVTLLGAETYVITAPPGKTRTEIIRATYQYSYYACGEINVGMITVNRKNNELNIFNCDSTSSVGTIVGGSPVKKAELVINNRSHKTLDMAFLGLENYAISAGPGKTRLNVVRGTYQYSYYDCGKLIIGHINVVPKGFELKILNCGGLSSFVNTSVNDASENPEGDVLLLVNNEQLRTLDLGLVSASSDVRLVSVEPGKTRLTVFHDVYRYSYYACGKLIIGTMRISKNGSELTITRCGGDLDGKAQTSKFDKG